MNCAARAAIALMDKSQARHAVILFFFRIEAERENFCLLGIISISLCVASRRGGGRVKNPFSPPDIIYTQTYTHAVCDAGQAPLLSLALAHTPVLRGFETRAWQKKNFGREEGKRQQRASEED